MRSLGIEVPPAFVLTTATCQRFYDNERTLPSDILEALPEAIAYLEGVTGRTFGSGERPLLVSVRSGAAQSMPGMMDTILNLGMTDDIEAALARQSGDTDYAADTRRRFLAQFENVVGAAAPDQPWEQLTTAIEAVFASWQSRRAIAYRKDRGLPDIGGTAVTVQAMVFGNLDEDSGTGVLFTRNPLSGDNAPYGEWLPRGQGEDVVSGRFDALPLDDLARAKPSVHEKLMNAATLLEANAADVQDIEFTIESGKLWLLQARSAKRSPEAAVKLAVAFHAEGRISPDAALERITVDQVSALLRPRLDSATKASAILLARGKSACPGIASGVVVTDPFEAEDRADDEPIVLARPMTEPDDVAAMAVSAAVVTELGGATSHAAVVCREMGVPSVVGCGKGALEELSGRVVTVDATAGEVYDGLLPVVESTVDDDPNLRVLVGWAQEELRRGAASELSEFLTRKLSAALPIEA
ncbi:pyruvate, phosphate dikinase [Rhodococcus sp. SC4]|nr:pyruvate, phosphate dikinase [Rhodococcus sp. SC4]